MLNDEGMPNFANDETDAREIAFWEGSEAVVREEPDSSPKYDLEERTARFGEAVIDFARTIPQGPVTNRLIDQLVGCGTSIGANYCEADDAVSRKEFFLRIGNCRKEARETKHFLRMIVTVPRSEGLSPAALARSAQATSHLLQNLPQQMT